MGILPKCGIPKRYVIVFMIFMAYSNMTILHTNLSMAVVDMTTFKNVTRQGDQGHCYELKAAFDWTSEQKGLILSSYSYGRLLSPIGGILAHKVGGSTICSIGNLAMAVITLLSPVILSLGFDFFLIMYLVFGAFESLILPGVSEIIARWAPNDERFRFVAFGEVGFFFGSIASFALSGLLLEKYNWQTLFYCSGLFSFAWFWIWLLIVKNDPSEDKNMSKSERKFIQENQDFTRTEGKLVYPWRQIATFMPLWVGSLAEFAIICGLTFTSVNLPQYIKDTSDLSISQIGFISTIPQICALISMPASGCFADYIRSLGKFSKTNLHKLFASISLFSAAIFYGILVVSPNFVADIVAISLYQFFCTLLLVDITVLFLDISPTYTAFLMSIVNTFAITSGFIIPSMVEFIVTSHSLSQWNTCFIIFSGMYFSVGLLYLKFVSAEQPTWAKIESEIFSLVGNGIFFVMMNILPKFRIPKRCVIVFMIFMAYSNITILHTNLSMAVIDMTTIKNISSQGDAYELKAEFNWTSEQKGFILASYSYGRLFSPIGGVLANKLGGSTICSMGNLVMAIITLLSPLILSVDFNFFFIMYLIFGVFESLIISGIPEIISCWAPPEERSRFVSFGEVGFFFGSIASFILCGLLLEKFPWQTVFYCCGLASFVWFWIWLIVVKNDPSEDTNMSESEREYIRDKLNHSDDSKKLVYPWSRIACFAPLWVGSLAEFSIVSGLIFTSVFLPQYIEDTTNTDITQIGFISTLPQICALISMPISGCFADYLRSLGKLSNTNLHRLLASISLFSAAIFYAVIAICQNFLVNIVAISLYQFFCTFFLADITVLFLDISPKYTALLLSIVNTCAISSGFLVPVVVEFIVISDSPSQWNVCFAVYSSLYICVGLLYLKFVSAEQPTWAKTESNNDQNYGMK